MELGRAARCVSCAAIRSIQVRQRAPMQVASWRCRDETHTLQHLLQRSSIQRCRQVLHVLHCARRSAASGQSNAIGCRFAQATETSTPGRCCAGYAAIARAHGESRLRQGALLLIRRDRCSAIGIDAATLVPSTAAAVPGGAAARAGAAARCISPATSVRPSGRPCTLDSR